MLVYDYCPLCGAEHSIHKFTRAITSIYFGKAVPYEETYFVCDEAEEEFIPAKTMDENVQALRVALKEAGVNI